jgi:glutamine amidotransferase
MATLGIIDYKMGNLRSVQKAFEHVGAQAVVLSSAAQIQSVDKLVLPGVGAFADGMAHLRDMGFAAQIKAFIAADKPFLGICLGMQLLFDSSQEDAASPTQPIAGLGVFRGQVVRFEEDQGDGQRIKVPHMGWNNIQFKADDPLFDGLKQDDAVYFVHGYYARPDDAADTSAVCAYGQPFCASVWRKRIWATQFHPEKSQHVGLRMLENFARS